MRESSYVLKGAALIMPGKNLGRRDGVPRPAARWILLLDENKPFSFPKRQRLEQDGVDSGENHRVGANAERQSKYSNSGEGGSLGQHPQSEVDVLPQVIPPEPMTGL